MIDDLVTTDEGKASRYGRGDHPHRVTVLGSGVSVSYHGSEVDALAAALVSLDVEAGERVLIVMPDGSGFEDAVVGTIRQGAIPLPVNPSLPARDVSGIAAQEGIRLVVVTGDSAVLGGLDVARTITVPGWRGVWAMVASLR